MGETLGPLLERHLDAPGAAAARIEPSGEELAGAGALGPDDRIRVASVTKLVTALLAVGHLRLDEPVLDDDRAVLGHDGGRGDASARMQLDCAAGARSLALEVLDQELVRCGELLLRREAREPMRGQRAPWTTGGARR